MFLSPEDKEKRKENKERRKELKININQKTIDIEALEKQHKTEFMMLNYRIEEFRASMVDKWEYLEVSNKYKVNLDDLGDQGWELIGISTFAEGAQTKTIFTKYVLKRKKHEVPLEVYGTSLDELQELRERIDLEKAAIAQMENEFYGI